ncbi:hypothetical protein [Paenibacillus sp. 1-18]|uniref:hypothetical protein n=1 Tax=Paenibacillus sp. 1-18 TaxID=1333846 RepID=UPI00046FF94F|nr:hypothetical protein [Paenibacillus sp. 1-18]
MYPPVVNSPKTELAELITDTQTEITVANASVLLQGDGIAVLGNGDVAETITYTTVEDNVLKGCVRGFEGVARAWPAGTRVARNFTAADWRAAINNIQALYEESSIEVRKTVTLQPGVQIAKADRQAVFSLTGLTGKTVIDYEGQKGLFGVRNPYVIRYGENLLPSFYEWSATTQAGTATITGPNQVRLDKSAGLSGFNTQAYNVNAVPATDYTLSVTVDVSNIGGTVGAGAYWNLQAIGKNGEVLADLTTGPFVTSNGTKTMVKTFTTPANTSYLRVVVGLDIATTGTAVFRDVSINIGSTAKPFKPREDSMLALQTDLYADPITGANEDTVFERDGQYFKSKKWRGVTLDGNLPWTLNATVSGTGFKAVQLFQYTGVAGASTLRNALVSKFDGKILENKGSAVGSAGDQHNGIYPIDNAIVITVGVADSGWGDSYTPSSDDIKAYFMGWKMYDTSAGNTTAPYNRTDGQSKGWVRRRLSDGAFVDGTGTLPTAQAPEYTPYKLVYQLATPTVEPIVSEGQLTFNEGDNQVEVGTGLVIREKAKLYQEADTKRWNLNNGSPGEYQASLTAYRIDRFIGIYRNSQRDNWILYPNTTTPAGAMAQLPGAAYDANAVYTLSYLAFITSPVVPFTGSYAANEKSLLLDLVDTVQQNTTRVSVLENKKAEKDSPAWIMLTALSNGWINRGNTGDHLTSYFKDDSSIVRLRGVIKSGVVNTEVFRLPAGYRPDSIYRFPIITYNSSSTLITSFVSVSPNGSVQIAGNAGNDYVIIDGIEFLAEQ